jgi:hypothetical protein
MFGSVRVLRSETKKKPLHFTTPHMADPQMLTAEGEAYLRELINERIGGVFLVMTGLRLSFLYIGTDMELEVLFDAALNGGRLDWADVVPKIDGQGPLLVLARTDKGYGTKDEPELTFIKLTAMCLAGSVCCPIAETLDLAKTINHFCFGWWLLGCFLHSRLRRS